MVEFFLLLSVFSGLMSYLNMDPMKSSFFLIFSLLSLVPLISFLGNVWFSYFISLLFLSGIFVILVYFSSLSSSGQVKVYWLFLLFILTLFFLVYNFGMLLGCVGLNFFYYSIFWFVIYFIVGVLLFFMNFTSYFLSFSGALRKI